MNWDNPPDNFQYILFERTNRAQNERRFYTIIWQPTLLEAQAVVRIWGRRGGWQCLKTHPFATLNEAWPLIRRLIRLRLRHGYTVVQPERYRPGVEQR
jgi:predicted DNA-binding WGR domain protein